MAELMHDNLLPIEVELSPSVLDLSLTWSMSEPTADHKAGQLALCDGDFGTFNLSIDNPNVLIGLIIAVPSWPTWVRWSQAS